MRYDFAASGRSARDLIPVPELPLESIRHRSRTASARGRLRALTLCVTICLAGLGAGAAFGEKIYAGVRVWLAGGKAAVVVSSLVMVREPTAADLRNVVARATFPIILPAGVPAGTRVTMIMFAPAERPNSVTVVYRNDRARFNVGFSLFDSAAVNTNHAMLPAGSARPLFRADYQWQIGSESVFVLKEHISAVDANRIKGAMLQASPADSLALTAPMLRKVTVVGGAPALADAAERYAPREGRSVLLDRQQTRQIPRLVMQHKPVLDSRIIYLSNIPSVQGEPDYSKATLHWPKITVISEGGVRAIDAVLRSTGNRDDCGCEILFNQPNKTTYLVWKLPMSTSAVKKFSVDAKTFVVTQATG